MRVARWVVLAAVVTAGCSGGTRGIGERAVGRAVGYMHIAGRPEGKPLDQRVPGTVEVHLVDQRKVLELVSVDETGMFSIPLPAGRYELVGRPSNRGLDSMKSKAFRVDLD